MPSAAQKTAQAKLLAPELLATTLASLTRGTNFETSCVLAVSGTVVKAITLCQSQDADCETCKGQFLIPKPPCFHWMCSFKAFAAL